MKTYDVNFSVTTEVVDRERFFQDMLNLCEELSNPFSDYEFAITSISPEVQEGLS